MSPEQSLSITLWVSGGRWVGRLVGAVCVVCGLSVWCVVHVVGVWEKQYLYLSCGSCSIFQGLGSMQQPLTAWAVGEADAKRPYVNVNVNVNEDAGVDVNVNVNRRAARNGRNEKHENEKQITVTAAPFSGINFQLQLQSCLRGELIRYYSYRRVLSGI